MDNFNVGSMIRHEFTMYDGDDRIITTGVIPVHETLDRDLPEVHREINFAMEKIPFAVRWSWGG